MVSIEEGTPSFRASLETEITFSKIEAVATPTSPRVSGFGGFGGGVLGSATSSSAIHW
jgi:hypothetical protein